MFPWFSPIPRIFGIATGRISKPSLDNERSKLACERTIWLSIGRTWGHGVMGLLVFSGEARGWEREISSSDCIERSERLGNRDLVQQFPRAKRKAAKKRLISLNSRIREKFDLPKNLDSNSANFGRKIYGIFVKPTKFSILLPRILRIRTGIIPSQGRLWQMRIEAKIMGIEAKIVCEDDLVEHW